MTAPINVLTAVTDTGWETELVATLDATQSGFRVIRRCVDLADLLATAAAGVAQVALISGDLRRLDADVVSRLARSGVAAVGVVRSGDLAGERRLLDLGVVAVVPAAGPKSELAATIRRAVAAPPALSSSHGWSDPRAMTADPRPAEPGMPEPALGRLVAVWGPTGAPGRTTVAVNLAAEAAGLGVSTVLVDADCYGGTVAPVLGLLDEAPGLAAAIRQANSAGLDLPGLSGLAVTVGSRLCVLTGIARAQRWPELRPTGLERVLELCRRLAALTVVDCGFCLEDDEELAFDTAAPRRNGATLTVLSRADTVVAVGAADPIGLQRLVRGLADLRDLELARPVLTVVNQVRAAAVGGGDPRGQIRSALTRYAKVGEPRFVPADRAACDRALAEGRLLAECASASPARLALRELAGELTGRQVSSRRPRLPRWPRALAQRST
ncbi:MAG TPA: hypothetical protein VNG13_12500 [Mycobacteriales bacterium]|nr:hypothetical protein [Mycobacteriales bacterium]